MFLFIVISHWGVSLYFGFGSASVAIIVEEIRLESSPDLGRVFAGFAHFPPLRGAAPVFPSAYGDVL